MKVVIAGMPRYEARRSRLAPLYKSYKSSMVHCVYMVPGDYMVPGANTDKKLWPLYDGRSDAKVKGRSVQPRNLGLNHWQYGKQAVYYVNSGGICGQLKACRAGVMPKN